MKGIKKTICLLLSLIMILSMGVPAFAFDNATGEAQANTTTSEASPFSIEISTDKSSYSATGIAKITAKVTNTSGKDIKNVSAEAVFGELAPCKKNSSKTTAEAETLKDGESLEFTYSATINKNAKKLNIFEKIILWFVRLFNGGYSAKDNGFDNGRKFVESYNDIKFGKRWTRNTVKVWYGEINEVKFEYLSSYPMSCYVDKAENVLFFVDVASTSKISNSEIELYIDDEFVGTLNDDGANGDITANDGRYSAAFSMYSKERRNAKYYIKYQNKIVYKNTFTFAKSQSEEEKQVIASFYDDIKKIKDKYRNNISDSKSSTVLANTEKCVAEIKEFLDSRSDISSYTWTGDYTGFGVIFDSGIVVGIPITDLTQYENISEMRLLKTSNNNALNSTAYKSNIITMQPFRNNSEFEDSIATDNAAQTIENQNNGYSFSSNLDNLEVTVNAMKSLAKYKVIILEGHGGNFGEEYGYIISLSETVTDEKNNDDYKDDIDNHRIYPNGDHYVVTEKFFDYYYSKNDFDNTLIYLGTCHGGDDNVGIRNILNNKGAEAVITYKNTVIIRYMHDLMPTIFEQLASGKTIAESIEEAKSKHGEHDPYISGDTYESLNEWQKFCYNLGLIESANPAELVLTGNDTNSKLLGIAKGEVYNQSRISSEESKPLKGTKITITGEKENKVIYADKDGKFDIKLPEGSYEFLFEYEDNNGKYVPYKSTVKIDVGKVNDLHTIYLSRKGGLVSGKVIDKETKKPISGLKVSFDIANNGEKVTYTSVKTSETGTFLTNLPLGAYSVSFDHDDYEWRGKSLSVDADEIDMGTIELERINRSIIASGLCGANGSNVKWELDSNGTLTISGEGEMRDYFGNFPWEYIKKQVKTVKIENGVTNISCLAFSFCEELTSVVIPNSVTRIGYEAFRGCTSLANVTIPNSITNIEGGTFSECMNLTSVTIPNSVTRIGYEAFLNCTNLADVNIPDSVIELGSSAFERCRNLTIVTIPNSIRIMGSDVFEYTAWYEEQPKGNVYAGKVYYKYKGTIPKNTTITINDGTKGIAAEAFEGCTGLTSITIPDGVTNIGDNAFFGCSNLTSIIIPNSVTSIGGWAFCDCVSLTNVNIPNSVNRIAPHTFYNCGLTSVTIPNSVTNIDGEAFCDCSSLTNITIPDSVIRVANKAFAGCTSLLSITITNPTCEINDTSINETATIYGYKNSTAQAYAEKYHRTFIPLD